MRLMLPDGQIIGNDRLISNILRFDSTPVVANLEFQCSLTPELDQALQEGSIVYVGDKYIEFTIIKRAGVSAGFVKDGQQIKVGAYIAVLSGCEKLIQPAAKAILLKNSSIGAAFRASGNKIKVAEDVPIMQYFCAVGATPTYELARKFREEAAVTFLNQEGRIIVKRLSNILEGEPKLTVQEGDVNWVGNPAELIHDVPNYISVNADGSTIEGTLNSGAKTGFYPNMDARRLRNLKTVLVTRGTLMRAYMPNLMAGDVVQVGESRRLVVLTAVHRSDSGVLGGPTVSATKLWLAEVVTL